MINIIKIFQWLTLLLISSTALASPANIPPPIILYMTLSVYNNTEMNIASKVKPYYGTMMVSAPSKIAPGHNNIFSNKGDGFTTPGFTLTIGSDSKPNGQCTVTIAARDDQHGLVNADGSQGFTCEISHSHSYGYILKITSAH